MKILKLVTGLGIGGAEQVVISLSEDFSNSGHEILLVYLGGEPAIYPRNHLVRLRSLGIKTAFDLLPGLFRLRRYVLDFKPDIVHSHMFHANMIARFLRIFLQFPCLICTAHSSNEGGKFRMFLYSLTDSLTNISTNVSNVAVDSFIEKKATKAGRMITVYNGVDVDRFSFRLANRELKRRELLREEGVKILLAVGRLEEAKDYENMIFAINNLQLYENNFKLFIVGDGPLRSRLNSLVVSLKLADHIFFLGARNDVESLMSAADIFILSSAWEGFPLVILEAMACERVVVATDCGGVREAMGETGLIVEPKNFMALSGAIRAAMSLSLAEFQNCGFSARQRIIDLYSSNIIKSKWLELYQSECK